MNLIRIKASEEDALSTPPRLPAGNTCPKLVLGKYLCNLNSPITKFSALLHLQNMGKVIRYYAYLAVEGGPLSYVDCEICHAPWRETWRRVDTSFVREQVGHQGATRGLKK